jgi:hypothetical protein
VDLDADDQRLMERPGVSDFWGGARLEQEEGKEKKVLANQYQMQ